MRDGSMSGRGQDFAEWGEAVMDQLRGPVAARIRKRLAVWRDPRARLLRRRQRARRITVAAGVTTGVFGGGTFASVAPHLFSLPLGTFGEVMLDLTSVGFGGVTVLAGAATLGAGLRYRALKRAPLPDPPVELPPPQSQAYEPIRRLRDAARSLQGSLLQLTARGMAKDTVSDVRRTASEAVAAMQEVAGRLVAVEAAVPHVPGTEQDSLRGEVRRLRAELDEGLTGYGSLVAAAGHAVAAAGVGDQRQSVQDATDRLAGLAAALRELSGGPPEG